MYDKNNILVFMYVSTRYCCKILMKREFSRHIFKILKYQISLNSVQLEPSFMQMDRQIQRSS
jgi:hypothetical protein